MRPALLRIILVVVTLAVFWPAVRHEFVDWDDYYTIVRNPALNPPSFELWLRRWNTKFYDMYYPVTHGAWGLIAAVAYQPGLGEPSGGRLNPWVFHAANVLLHALSALVVFAILRLLVRRDAAAWIGAMLFALHPVQVEPVAWASGLKDVLSGLLSLVALWQYLLFARADVSGDLVPKRRRHYLAATMMFALAMLAKPSAVVVPVLAAVIDLMLVKRPPRRVALALLPWIILVLPVVAVTRSFQPADERMAPVSWWARPLIAGDALTFYACKLVLPLRLGLDYGRTPGRVLAERCAYATWLFPAAAAAGLWLARRRAPGLGAAGALFLTGLLPVLGFVAFHFQQYSTVTDHYLYLPMLGPALALAWLLDRSPSRALTAACVVALCALGFRSVMQIRTWADDQTLFTHALSVNPSSFVSHNNLGAAMLRSGRVGDAVDEFNRALRLKPDYELAQRNLALARQFQGEMTAPAP